MLSKTQIELLNKQKKLKTEYENLRQEYLTMESNYNKIKQLTNY